MLQCCTMLYNDVCSLVENVQQELCNDVITMHNVTEQCVTMLHEVIMMCTYVQSYICIVTLIANVREHYASVCNISFDVTVMLQQCA